MSITLKELEMLAREYCFDVDEARAFLGKDIKKRGRPSKNDSDDETPKKTPATKGKSTSPRTKDDGTKPKRSPSGYNLFVKKKGVSITEAAKQWKALTDSRRQLWNNKAKAMG